MSRPLRLQFPGALYHLTSRGDGGEAIFRDETDREILLAVLARVISEMRWKCPAYCLMGNHYHLLIETPEPNLSRGMRHLNGIYTQRFNRRHARTGHVFQGRFHAVLVDRDAYLLQAARYVVLNPVRAGLVARPEAWKWSSYRATAGLRHAPGWLTTGAVLGLFACDLPVARQRYVEFVGRGMRGSRLWDQLAQPGILGSEEFASRVLSGEAARSAGEIPRAERTPRRPLEWYRSHFESGALAMTEAFRSGHYSLAAIARHFGLHYSTVSRAVRRTVIGRSATPLAVNGRPVR